MQSLLVPNQVIRQEYSTAESSFKIDENDTKKRIVISRARIYVTKFTPITYYEVGTVCSSSRKFCQIFQLKARSTNLFDYLHTRILHDRHENIRPNTKLLFFSSPLFRLHTIYKIRFQEHARSERRKNLIFSSLPISRIFDDVFEL